ncbi:hypothetical protein [Saccharomonospora sp. NB11]|jgi:hypothetical protein|uniref:hypothetical protein n=1 Tax=Saccharomonospora sp. NB11 TaxID=1642298 RepID=UPI0018D07C21|nr:hypothetical protein [Saccharomonospora sp. NB11]
MRISDWAMDSTWAEVDYRAEQLRRRNRRTTRGAGRGGARRGIVAALRDRQHGGRMR